MKSLPKSKIQLALLSCLLRASTLTVLFILGAVATATAQYSVIQFDGIGPVRMGMSLTQLNKALRTSYSTPSDPDEKSCFYEDVPDYPGLVIMLLEGRVARIDVLSTNTHTHTTEGIRLGDTEAHAKQVYGTRLRIEPHAYNPDTGHYLTLQSPDGKFGIKFETEDGRITSYYAGTLAAIAQIEGCN